MTTENSALKGRILVIDDDPILRSMLAISLSEAGHEVIQADDGATALQLLQQLHSTNNLPDALVTDIQMPRMGGLELLAQLLATEISVPAVAMTAVGDKDLVIQLLRLGVEEFIDKPFNMDEICQRIGTVLRRNRSRQSQSGLEINFEGQRARLDKDSSKARRILERMRNRVDTSEAEDRARIHLPTSTEHLDLAWNSRQTRELSGKMVAHATGPDSLVILFAHPAGHDTLALQTSTMIRMLFSASCPGKACGEDFLRLIGTLLYQQPQQTMVRALLLRFDFSQNSLDIAAAGHPTPIIVPHSSPPHGLLGESGSELGPHPAPHIALGTFPFRTGDRLIVPCPWLPLLSKIHAPTGASLHLGVQGITAMIQESRAQPLGAMIASVWGNAMEFAHWNAVEDMLLVGIERRA